MLQVAYLLSVFCDAYASGLRTWTKEGLLVFHTWKQKGIIWKCLYSDLDVCDIFFLKHRPD